MTPRALMMERQSVRRKERPDGLLAKSGSLRVDVQVWPFSILALAGWCSAGRHTIFIIHVRQSEKSTEDFFLPAHRWFLIALLAVCGAPALAFISYYDDKGTKHFVQDESEIPEKYRGQPKDYKPPKPAKKAAAPKPGAEAKKEEAPLQLPAAKQSPEAPVPKGMPKEAFGKDGQMRPIAYMIKGAALFDGGRFAEATEFYEKALSVNQKNPELQGEALDQLVSQLADAYFFQNKFAEAIPHMKKVLEGGRLAPKGQAHNHFNLACAYHELGQFDEAARELKVTLAVAKASPELLGKYEMMARTDKQLAKLQARPDFEQLLKGEDGTKPGASAPSSNPSGKSAERPASDMKTLVKPLQAELDKIAVETQDATKSAAQAGPGAGKIAGQLFPPLLNRCDQLRAEWEKLPASSPSEKALVKNRVDWMDYQRKMILASQAILTGGQPPADFDALPKEAERLAVEGEKLMKKLGYL